MKDFLSTGVRQHFVLFLMRTYAELHPGVPPLEVGWYLKAICHALVEAHANEGTRLVINVPPRHLKSIAVSVAYTAWLLGRDPTLQIMVATYNEDLARLHARNCRRVMESDWYKALFPTTRIDIRGKRLLELRTTQGGSRKAVSVNGGVTGHGADVIIMDDCLKADEARSEARRAEVKAWFDGTLATRITNLGSGTIISISQRLHEDDPPAYLLEKGYAHLCLPAIGEKDERIPIGPGMFHRHRVGELLGRTGHTREKLEMERRRLGNYTFAAQYQQSPAAPEGNLIRLPWFGTFDEQFTRPDFYRVVQSWDTGLSDQPGADYSVCTTWGFRTRHWHLVDLVRHQFAYPDLRRAVLRQNRIWTPDVVLIEDAGTGKALWQELRHSDELRPVMWSVDADKETRLIGVTGELEAGLCLLPAQAPWLDAFRSELRMFPYGSHDDQVDSMTQFLQYYIARKDALMTARDKFGRPLRINRPSRMG